MKIRALLLASLFAATACMAAEEPGLLIVRDLLAPPSFFQEPITKAVIDPRERLAAEGITFGKEESIAYDPATSRVFVKADAAKILRLETLFEAELKKGFAQVFLTYQILETRKPLLADDAAATTGPKGDPDSGARIVDEAAVVEPVNPALVSTRIFTNAEQVDSLIKRVRGADLGTVRPASQLSAKSGDATESWAGDALTRNVPVISADASTVEMTLTLLQGRAGADPQIISETKIAVFSGGTAAFEERLGETTWRTRLITALVVDPAGEPLPARETTGLPGEERTGLGGSLFPGPVPIPALEKVRSIILPSLVFQETPLLEAIEMLKKASIEHDQSQPESQRGLDIRYWHMSPESLAQKPVTLRLANVPLIEAIRYTASVAGCDYRVEGGSVLIGVFPKKTDLSGAEEIWYAAYLRGREAEDLDKAGRKEEAKSKHLQALKLYEALRERHPDFAAKAVAAQVARLKEKLAEE
jgi:hypothetical protein